MTAPRLREFVIRWMPWLTRGYWRLRGVMRKAHDFLVRRAAMNQDQVRDRYTTEGFPGVRQPKVVPSAIDPRYGDIVLNETATCPCCLAAVRAGGGNLRHTWPLAECVLDPIGGDAVYSTRFFVYCPECMTPMQLPDAYRETHLEYGLLNLEGGRHGR